MSRLACVVLLIGAASAAAAPSGRVVRIARDGRGATAAPRLCEVRGDTGNCVGEQPEIGQVVTVLDEHRATAEVQIVEAKSFVAGCPNLWTVRTRVVRGGPVDGDGIGLIDPALDPNRGRVLDKAHAPPSPSGHGGEEVWRAIDRDGDGEADIVITRYGCDATGKIAAAATTYCVDVWARIGAKLVRTTQLNFAQCNI